MSEGRYQQLQDAITKARAETSCYIDLNCCYDCKERYAHLDTLQAILDLHKPLRFVHYPEIGEDNDGYPIYGDPEYERGAACCNCVTQSWPCPDVATVVTALKRMGAL